MKKKKSPASKNGTCFVIMPFGGYFDTYFEDIYVPAVDAAGLSPRRADDIFRPSPIINDIWQLTRESKVVLADLSKKNPNVFYELGLAHALSKPAILVTESISDVPFDLQALRVLVYNKEEPDWGAELATAITKSIKEVLAAPQSAVLPTFLNVRDSAPKPTVSSQEAEILQIRQEIAALRRQVAVGDGPTERSRRVDIGPNQARDMIRQLIRDGVPPDVIIDTVRRLGPPADWVSRQMDRIRLELSKQAELPIEPEKKNETKKAEG